MSANGCGPRWFPKKLTGLFNCFFKDSCDRHDEAYAKGGDEISRFECDWKFWIAMQNETLKHRGVGRAMRWLNAVLFYAWVRALGWTRFNYT